MSILKEKYEAVIGLEVHVQLLTNSKIFSSSSAAFGGAPNSKVDPVCLGLPGVLPVLNRQTVNFAMRVGLATNCKIGRHSIFARKNYFYPDLPKGYQISQFEEPVCEHGYLDFEVNGQMKRVGITRIHLEEDAGKSIHAEEFVGSDETLVDVNRCGVPLVEIVSEPDIRLASEAVAYLVELRRIVQYLGLCDGNMEEGSLRCDANISIRPVGGTELGVKTELKNMNSISGVENAINYEIHRQIELLESGGAVTQQTLLWNADKGIARAMRSKEYSHDYRYFPDPDLVPLEISDAWLQEVKSALPELPRARKNRLIAEYKLPQYDAEVLTATRPLADYFEATAGACADAKAASNWIMGEVLRYLKENEITIEAFSVPPGEIAELLNLVGDGTINLKVARIVFGAMLETGKRAAVIVKEKGLVQVSDTAQITAQVRMVLSDHPAEVEKYVAGKEQVVGFLVGQVMRATRGQANPKIVNEVLRTELQALADS